MFTSANVNGLNGFVNGICGFRLGGEVNMMHLRISGFDGVIVLWVVVHLRLDL